MSLFRDYNDFQTQLGNTEAQLNLYVLINCADNLVSGDKTTFTLRENNYTLPLLRTALDQIISENTHLTQRAEEMQEALRGDLFQHLEPTYDELNPPPEPEKEYRFSLGDEVYLGAQQYEILTLGEDEVWLFDPSFPLLNKELSRQDFDRMVSENPLNDRYLVPVSAVPDTVPAEETGTADSPPAEEAVQKILHPEPKKAEIHEEDSLCLHGRPAGQTDPSKRECSRSQPALRRE